MSRASPQLGESLGDAFARVVDADHRKGQSAIHIGRKVIAPG
jgi:hypothetical protein